MNSNNEWAELERLQGIIAARRRKTHPDLYTEIYPNETPRRDPRWLGTPLSGIVPRGSPVTVTFNPNRIPSTRNISPRTPPPGTPRRQRPPARVAQANSANTYESLRADLRKTDTRALVTKLEHLTRAILAGKASPRDIRVHGVLALEFRNRELRDLARKAKRTHRAIRAAARTMNGPRVNLASYVRTVKGRNYVDPDEVARVLNGYGVNLENQRGLIAEFGIKKGQEIHGAYSRVSREFQAARNQLQKNIARPGIPSQVNVEELERRHRILFKK